MTLYIPVDSVEKFSHKVDLMLAHFANKPVVTYSDPRLIELHTYTVGYEGSKLYKEAVNAIEVNVSDVELSGWKLVATVDYCGGFLTIVDNALFKHIPACYGVEYTKCDYCGNEHSARKYAHILFNEEEGKWMQVGTSCVNKMIDQGKYLAEFCYKLHTVVKDCFGCSLDSLGGWGGSIDKSYVLQAVSTMDALKTVVAYQKEFGTTWQKVSYVIKDGRSVKIDGTNDYLQSYYLSGKAEGEDCTELYAKVAAYVSTIDAKDSEFKEGIKNAFEYEFIRLTDIFRAWFALKMYTDSLVDFAGDTRKCGIVVGNKVAVKANLEAVERYEGFYGTVYTLKFKDLNTGFLFVKDCSTRDAASKYEKDGVYSFSATVKFVDCRKQQVVLGGRLSK